MRPSTLKEKYQTFGIGLLIGFGFLAYLMIIVLNWALAVIIAMIVGFGYWIYKNSDH